jgi:hypothetical protein
MAIGPLVLEQSQIPGLGLATCGVFLAACRTGSFRVGKGFSEQEADSRVCLHDAAALRAGPQWRLV